MSSEIISPEKQLENAFELFNQFSEKLAGSYSDLESQVARLTDELVEESNERLIQLAENKALATRLEGLLDALPAGIVVLDDENIITQTNPVACLMLASKADSTTLIGQKWKNVAQKSILTDDDELRLQDGRWINLSVCPLKPNDAASNAGKIILISDITENHNLQMKLNRQQRLSSLGEMIASLAHQIRTPLSSALLYISAINHPINTEQDRIRFADKTKERLRHLESMVNDMLVFARGDVLESEYINASEAMHQLKSLAENSDVAERIVFDLDSNLQNVKIKANHDVLQSALQNIIDNALEASVAIANADRDDATAVMVEVKALLNADNQFEINIKDNGCGMSRAIKDKALEPFFTTKSSGTGLGLAMVNATVNRYGGEIDIVSEVGVGSHFTITLPCLEVTDTLPSNISQLPVLVARGTAGQRKINRVNNFLSDKNIINVQFKNSNEQEVAL